jgi:hypothetical protein
MLEKPAIEHRLHDSVVSWDTVVLLLTGDVRAAEMLRHRGTVVCVRRQRHESIFASVTP